MSKKTYISFSVAACSCGAQFVQVPGSEMVKPRSKRPASMFFLNHVSFLFALP
jgi:hypothetical protein